MKVLRPVYERGEPEQTRDGKSICWERVARWVTVGEADSAEEAKRKFTPLQYGYALVLADS